MTNYTSQSSLSSYFGINLEGVGGTGLTKEQSLKLPDCAFVSPVPPAWVMNVM